MQQAAEGEQPRLLLARGVLRGAADADVDFLAVVVAHHIGFRNPLRHCDHRHPPLVVHAHFLVERQDYRVYFAAEHRVHQPLLEIVAPNAGDGAVILHAEDELAAAEVRQGDDFLRQALRAFLIALELHAGVLPVGE